MWKCTSCGRLKEFIGEEGRRPSSLPIHHTSNNNTATSSAIQQQQQQHRCQSDCIRCGKESIFELVVEVTSKDESVSVGSSSTSNPAGVPPAAIPVEEHTSGRRSAATPVEGKVSGRRRTDSNKKAAPVQGEEEKNLRDKKNRNQERREGKERREEDASIRGRGLETDEGKPRSKSFPVTGTRNNPPHNRSDDSADCAGGRDSAAKGALPAPWGSWGETSTQKSNEGARFPIPQSIPVSFGVFRFQTTTAGAGGGGSGSNVSPSTWSSTTGASSRHLYCRDDDASSPHSPFCPGPRQRENITSHPRMSPPFSFSAAPPEGGACSSTFSTASGAAGQDQQQRNLASRKEGENDASTMKGTTVEWGRPHAFGPVTSSTAWYNQQQQQHQNVRESGEGGDRDTAMVPLPLPASFQLPECVSSSGSNNTPNSGGVGGAGLFGSASAARPVASQHEVFTTRSTLDASISTSTATATTLSSSGRPMGIPSQQQGGGTATFIAGMELVQWKCEVCGKVKKLEGAHLEGKNSVRSDCWPCAKKRNFVRFPPLCSSSDLGSSNTEMQQQQQRVQPPAQQAATMRSSSPSTATATGMIAGGGGGGADSSLLFSRGCSNAFLGSGSSQVAGTGRQREEGQVKLVPVATSTATCSTAATSKTAAMFPQSMVGTISSGSSSATPASSTFHNNNSNSVGRGPAATSVLNSGGGHASTPSPSSFSSSAFFAKANVPSFVPTPQPFHTCTLQKAVAEEGATTVHVASGVCSSLSAVADDDDHTTAKNSGNTGPVSGAITAATTTTNRVVIEWDENRFLRLFLQKKFLASLHCDLRDAPPVSSTGGVSSPSMFSSALRANEANEQIAAAKRESSGSSHQHPSSSRLIFLATPTPELSFLVADFDPTFSSSLRRYSTSSSKQQPQQQQEWEKKGEQNTRNNNSTSCEERGTSQSGGDQEELMSQLQENLADATVQLSFIILQWMQSFYSRRKLEEEEDDDRGESDFRIFCYDEKSFAAASAFAYSTAAGPTYSPCLTVYGPPCDMTRTPSLLHLLAATILRGQPVLASADAREVAVKEVYTACGLLVSAAHATSMAIRSFSILSDIEEEKGEEEKMKMKKVNEPRSQESQRNKKIEESHHYHTTQTACASASGEEKRKKKKKKVFVDLVIVGPPMGWKEACEHFQK